jgi:hypothetical protein
LDFGAAVLCPTYFPEGQDCTLPLNPGKYGGGDPLTITLGDIPDILGILHSVKFVFTTKRLRTASSLRKQKNIKNLQVQYR